jgi:hypothetical protein
MEKKFNKMYDNQIRIDYNFSLEMQVYIKDGMD